MFLQTHLSCSRVSVYESTSPGGFSHDAWRLLTPELLRVMVLNAMGTTTQTNAERSLCDPVNQKEMSPIVFLCVFIHIFVMCVKIEHFSGKTKQGEVKVHTCPPLH